MSAASDTARDSFAKKDVLTRLDSLIQTTDSKAPAEESGSPITSRGTYGNGILKSKDSSNNRTRKKKSIRFPDNEELHEIIGYGGDLAQFQSESSEDEEAENRGHYRRNRSKNGGGLNSDDDHITVEERNIINLTKKNTDFNSRSANLSADGGVRLGAEKKPAPLITVRPFVQNHSPGKVNKVKPMINGELVKAKTNEVKTQEKVTSFSSSAVTTVTKPSATDVGSRLEVKSVVKSTASNTKEESIPKTNGNANASVSSSLALARLSFLNSMSSDETSTTSAKTLSVSPAIEQNTNNLLVEDATKNEDKTKTATAHVRLTRKSPYVSNAILRGTPKPVVLIKKPPVPKDKPKIPAKITSNASQQKENRSDAKISPTRNSFRSKKNAAPDIPKPGEVTISDNSKIEVTSSDINDKVSEHAAFYTSEADTQNEVIFEVNATKLLSSEQTFPAKENNNHNEEGEDDYGDHPEKELAEKSNEVKAETESSKNNIRSNKEEALEAIRKSLQTNDKDQVNQSSEDNSENTKSSENDNMSLPSRASFEDKRATIANSLGFNRHERPSTKRPAPKPPAVTSNNNNNNNQTVNNSENSQLTLSNEGKNDCKVLENGSIERDNSEETSTTENVTGKGSNTKKHNVKFSPDTKKEDHSPQPMPISYNRWITKGSGLRNGVIESSFTGQPIQMAPVTPAGSVVSPPVQITVPQNDHIRGLKAGSSKSPIGYVSTGLPKDDEVRKWTEKKRSKSVQPRGSEIDELMGSSKTKPKSKFFNAVMPSSIVDSTSSQQPSIKRQSRVELYENDRKTNKNNNNNKFSFSKIFKQFTHAASTGSLSSFQSDNGNNHSPHRFMDEEHEREIVERERSKLRPNIIHPLDFHKGAVEVVPIRPKNGHSPVTKTSSHQNLTTAVNGNNCNNHHVFEKHRTAGVYKGTSGGGTTKSILKTKVEYVDSKDSGHETSSIHTENSDTSGSSDTHSSSLDESNGCEPMSGFEQQIVKTATAKINGRLKPIPPPRSHSLENFDSGSSIASSQMNEDSSEDSFQNSNLKSPAKTECSPYASSAIFDQQDSSFSSSNYGGDISGNTGDATTAPHSGYILPGKMSLGNVRVPAFNSSNLRPIVGGFEREENTFVNQQPNNKRSGSLNLTEEASSNSGNSNAENHVSEKYFETSKVTGNPNYAAVVSANRGVLAQILQQAVTQQRLQAEKLRKELSEEQIRNLTLNDFKSENDQQGENCIIWTNLETAAAEAAPGGGNVKLAHCKIQNNGLPVTLVKWRKNGSEKDETDIKILPNVAFIANFESSSEFVEDRNESQVVHCYGVYNRFSMLQDEHSFREMTSKSLEGKDICQILHELIVLIKSELVNAKEHWNNGGGAQIRPSKCAEEEYGKELILNSNFLVVKWEEGYQSSLIKPQFWNDSCFTASISGGDEEIPGTLSHKLLRFALYLMGGGDFNARSKRSDFNAKVMSKNGIVVPIPKAYQKDEKLAVLIDMLKRDNDDLDAVQQMLEFMLFGPEDSAEHVSDYQHWLDLERAKFLNKIISDRGLTEVVLSREEMSRLQYLVTESDHEKLQKSSQKFSQTLSKLDTI